MNAALQLVARCPEQLFIVNHMAKPDVQGCDWTQRKVWEEGIVALAQYKNVHCKLSGFYAGNIKIIVGNRG